MRGGSLHEVLRRLRNAAGPAPGEGLADAELLRRWVASRDEAAFEVLVWRHGPMVLDLCRRWLSREHDADDAFQAAFYALARKAGAVRNGEGLAAWLHRVAFRICLNARSESRETALDREVVDQRSRGPVAEASARELRAVLDEEVSRLPERYRAPFILCYFAGRTNAEAARELGRPVGTILSRLATARQRLRVRLSRRGLAPTATAGVLTATAASQADVPAVLVSTTVKTATLFAAGGAAAGTSSAPAVALTEGVLKAMFAAKLKTAAAVVLSVALLGTGGGMFGYRAFAPGGAGAAEEDRPGPGAPAKPTANEEALRKQLAAMRQQLDAMREQMEHQEKMIKAQAEQLRRSAKGVRVFTPDDFQAQMEQFRRNSAAATPMPATTRPKTRFAASAAGDRAANLDDLHDALELQQAQVAIKKAHLEAANAELGSAKKRLSRFSVLAATKAIDDKVLDEARATVTTAEAQVRIREAELMESALRAKQVERRLKKNPDPKARPAKMEDRLLHLEMKLTELLKEVQSLRGHQPPQNPLDQP